MCSQGDIIFVQLGRSQAGARRDSAPPGLPWLLPERKQEPGADNGLSEGTELEEHREGVQGLRLITGFLLWLLASDAAKENEKEHFNYGEDLRLYVCWGGRAGRGVIVRWVLCFVCYIFRVLGFMFRCFFKKKFPANETPPGEKKPSISQKRPFSRTKGTRVPFSLLGLWRRRLGCGSLALMRRRQQRRRRRVGMKAVLCCSRRWPLVGYFWLISTLHPRTSS